jgi:hypothetical protein
MPAELPKCIDCDKPIDPRRPGHFELVEGWSKKRTQGGTNAVVMQKRKGKYLCAGCMMDREAGISKDQGSLL